VVFILYGSLKEVNSAVAQFFHTLFRQHPICALKFIVLRGGFTPFFL
jgi:hypothetical protein